MSNYVTTIGSYHPGDRFSSPSADDPSYPGTSGSWKLISTCAVDNMIIWTWESIETIQP